MRKVDKGEFRERYAFKLVGDQHEAFAANDEVFAGVQFGRIKTVPTERLALVIGAQVALIVEPGYDEELRRFYEKVWTAYRKGNQDLVALYGTWMDGLPKLDAALEYEPMSRSTLLQFAASGAIPPTPSPTSPPPPPPTRTTVVPSTTRPPGTSMTYGHLPFEDTIAAHDIFYRFEPWPSSRRITVGAAGSIAPGTFASPASELPFLPTGFAAIARNALPSLFPAVFRYELAPVAGAKVLCGAIVPMFGMAGGGVEVMFLPDPTTGRDTANRGAIANPAVVQPY